MGLINNLNSWFRDRIVGWLDGGGSPASADRSYSMASRRDYRLGAQKRFLRKSREGFDDNAIGNFIGLAIDRAVSLLFGKEISFEWDETAPDDLIQYIDGIWEANNKPVLLQKLAMYGAEDGTVFVKLVPDPERGWRIVAQDPMYKDITTDPDDDERVIRYTTQYKTQDLNGEEVAKRETILRGEYADSSPDNWVIRNEISSRGTGGKWKIISEEVWPYPAPPVIHWQNLPMVGNVWGMPDLPDDVIELQDKANFNLSNINRIVRLFAHPFRWSRGFGGRKVANQDNVAELDTGPDKMPNTETATSEIFQLPPVGDVPGAVGHVQNLRQIIFDVTRNTDITSMKDKVGALTNFGLRILFFDALGKLESKRSLYGWGLREINRRLQIFSGMEPVDCWVSWQDPLPVDDVALRQSLQMDLAMGVVSKETVAAKLGYDWEMEQERMQGEQQATENVGAMVLRNFERYGFGGGARQNVEVGNRQMSPVEPRQ